MTGMLGVLSIPCEIHAAAFQYTPLKLNVPISGTELAAPTESGGFVYVTYLAEYIQTVYNYLIGVSLIAAAVMIVYGGFLYIVGSGMGDVGKGKKVITDAVIGLLLVLGSYVILAAINPSLMVLDQLKLQVVRRAPEQDYLDENGSTPNDPKVIESAATPASIPPGPAMDITDINFEKTPTGAGKIDAINRKGRELFKAANTYQEKMDALAKVVAGYKHVCVDEGQCAYCEECATGDTAATYVSCSPQFAMRLTALANIDKIRSVTSDSRCFEIIGNPNYSSLAGCHDNPLSCFQMCSNYAVLEYQRTFGPVLTASGMWAGNCQSFAMGMYNQGLNYNLSKVLYDHANFPDNSLVTKYMKIEKGKTPTFDEESWMNAMKEFPTTFYVGHMVTFSQDIAAKGGLKFGDLIYISKGPAAGGGGQHWFLYTGGRPDIHFSFLEMGGGNAVVPGWGAVGGVKADPYGNTLVDYLGERINGQPPWWCNVKVPPKSCFDKNGKLIMLPPKANPTYAILVVYRPILENSAQSQTGE